jgi:ribosomal protein L11 methyltransferase
VALVRFTVGADPDLLDALADCLLSAGAGALEEGPCSLSAYVDSVELLLGLQGAVVDFRARAAEALPGSSVQEPEISEVAGDWQRAWLEHLVPERLTATFTARPTHAPDAPPDEHTIWLEPGLAFGEGGHASTRLAAQVVERWAQQHRGTRLLDVGTGTGVLSFVALASGMGTAEAIDIDAAAVDLARKNAAHNGMSERIVISDTPLEAVRGTFDLVVANMIAPTLMELGPALVARLAPGGLLVLSGLLCEDAGALCRAFSILGAHEVARHASGDWCCLELGQRSS